MNPYSPSSSPLSPPPYSDLQDVSQNPPLVQTGHSSLVLDPAPCRVFLDPHGGPSLARSPGSSLPGFSPRSPSPVVNPYPVVNPSPVVNRVVNPYPVSVLVPESRRRSEDLDLDPDPDLDLECSVCFSSFNNVFRCPKVLQCRHTFCLECLARINVKASEPSSIRCPLCRGLTPLPDHGLPRLDTDVHVLACLPDAMQRVYSIRFIRSKGRLQVKRPSDGRRWTRRSLASLRSINRSLDVGLPSPPEGGGDQDGGVGGALFRLAGGPACRAFLLTSVVMMLLMLTGIIIFLLTYRAD